MNNDRRKRIEAVRTSLSTHTSVLESLIAKANEALSEVRDKVAEIKDDVVSEIESLLDEEQETYDNMPEGLQGSERGELSQEAINQLGEALNFFDNIDTSKFEDVELDLSEADGPLENAAS